MKWQFINVALLTFVCLISAAEANETSEKQIPETKETSDAGSGKLTGNWNGMRTNLEDKGVTIDAVYTADFMSNVSGGIKEGNKYLDNLDLIFSFDGEKLYNVKGSRISLYFLNNNGGKINEKNVGSNQGVDNIEVSEDTAKLFEAWIEQNLFEDKLSLRAGLYNLNCEFYATDSSALFLNPTYGIGTDFSATGQNAPSIFPTTSPAFRVRWQPEENIYIQSAILDGVPGDPNNPEGTHIQLNDGDGALLVAQAGYKDANSNHLAAGIWEYTHKADDLVNLDGFGNPVKRTNKGAYLLGEKSLFQDKDNSAHQLVAFFRGGVANADVNQFDRAWSTGFTFYNFIKSRENSQLGFAISQARNTDKFIQAAGAPTDKYETEFELTFRDKILPWLCIQPDVQYTVNPGTDPTLDNSWLLGVRVRVDL